MRPLPKMIPAALAAAALVLTGLPSGTAAPAPAQGLRLFSPDPNPVLTVHEVKGHEDESWVEFNPAIYLGSAKTKFQVSLRRASASKPITAVLTVDGRTRELPSELLDGWRGFNDAFVLTWKTPAGEVLGTRKVDWCPNDGQPSRLGRDSVAETAFTYGCSAHPFTRGHRWGIDRGWARPVLEGAIEPPEAPLGERAILEVELRWALAHAFGLTAAQRKLTFDVQVKHVVEEGEEPEEPEWPGWPQWPDVDTPTGAARSAKSGAPKPPTSKAKGKLHRDTLPDLVSLPAYGVSTSTEDGRDLLGFAATVYNGGPGTLVAEGFRRKNQAVMDAYQFFYRGGRQVASRKVGTMEYDVRPSHSHWHFADFAVYDLIDTAKENVRTSGKEAFCLAPTDAINLLLPGAVVNPGNGDLSTACGESSSIWVREVLAAGWGDTYTQERAGQAIDITGLPNGTYWIRVTANPINRLHETTKKNNVSLRRVILGGSAGERTVTVPNYGLIDSETGNGPWWPGPGPGPVPPGGHDH